jgi:DNA polymerase-1
MPLVPVLSRIERTGVRIDSDELNAQSRTSPSACAELEERAYASPGKFNMGSPKQIGAIFFDELKLPVVAKTPKGAPSTSEACWRSWPRTATNCPASSWSTAACPSCAPPTPTSCRQMVNPGTGRVHTSYHQAVAATGRLSSSDPNLQNIPIRSDEGRRIRRAFVPGAGPPHAGRGLFADRAAHHGAPVRRRAPARRLRAGEDIHRATAAEILGLPPEQVTSEQRRSAKAINFGLIYGMSAFGLARQLGIERGEAQEYVDLYFARYPGVRTFMDRIRGQARADRYVETLFGRRLYLTNINHSNHQLRSAAERTAINAPMQGTAADIIKRAMIRSMPGSRPSSPPVRMIMQVHDELVFEVEAVAGRRRLRADRRHHAGRRRAEGAADRRCRRRRQLGRGAAATVPAAGAAGDPVQGLAQLPEAVHVVPARSPPIAETSTDQTAAGEALVSALAPARLA